MRTVSSTSSRDSRWPWLMVALGVVMIVSAAVFGYVSVSSVGTGHLDTVAFGEQIVFEPSDSYRANIFTPTESPTSTPTLCQVSTADGQPVTLRDATPYTVNNQYGLEATYGIHLEAGTTYLITCGEQGQAGRFAVVEVFSTPQRMSIAVGVAGAAMISAGVVILVVVRRRGQDRQHR